MSDTTFVPKLHFPFGPPPADREVFWRCEAKRYSTIIDAEREEYGVTPPRLEMTWWPVKHHTPKGVRLVHGPFINLSATKRWALPSQDEALQSFVARKRKQIQIYEARAAYAKRELALAIGPGDILS